MKNWYIPDCFWNSHTNGSTVSHEAICVLNATNKDAIVNITLYFEDRDPIGDFSVEVKANRTLHIRMDKIKNKHGQAVLQDTPYAAVVSSENENLYVQYTRVDSSDPSLTLCTTLV